MLRVSQTYPVERSRASFIDEDEIDGLFRGIDYIVENATGEVTRFSNFEVSYRTKGGFRVTAFNRSRRSNRRGETIGVSVESGSVRTFGDLEQLGQLRELIVRAQALLTKEP